MFRFKEHKRLDYRAFAGMTGNCLSWSFPCTASGIYNRREYRNSLKWD